MFAWFHSGAPRCRRFRAGSRGLTCARLGVVGFIMVRVGSLVRSLGRVMGSLGLFGFTLGNFGAPRGRRVHSGSRGCAPRWCRRVHNVSRGFTCALLMVAGFIRVRKQSLARP